MVPLLRDPLTNDHSIYKTSFTCTDSVCSLSYLCPATTLLTRLTTGVTEIWVSRKIGYPGVPIFPEILVSCRKFGYPRSRLLVTLVRSPSGVLTLTWTIQGLENNRESVLRWWAKFF